MASVTQRIKQITQPYSGYLKPSEFEKKEFVDNEVIDLTAKRLKTKLIIAFIK